MRLTTSILTASMLAAGLPIHAVAPTRTDFKIKTEADKSISPSQLQGKVVAVDFFGIWCYPCQQELPWFEDYSKRYADRGVVVLGAVEENSKWTRVSPYKQKMNVTCTWGMDLDDSFTRFNLEGLPSTVVIDRKGNVRYTHLGIINKDEVEKIIRSAL